MTTTIRHRHGQYLQQRPPRPQTQQSQRQRFLRHDHLDRRLRDEPAKTSSWLWAITNCRHDPSTTVSATTSISDTVTLTGDSVTASISDTVTATGPSATATATASTAVTQPSQARSRPVRTATATTTSNTTAAATTCISDTSILTGDSVMTTGSDTVMAQGLQQLPP